MRAATTTVLLLAALLLPPHLSSAGEEDAAAALVAELLVLDAPARPWGPVIKATTRPTRPTREARAEESLRSGRAPLELSAWDYPPSRAMFVRVRSFASDVEGDERYPPAWHKEVRAWIEHWRAYVDPAYRGELLEAARRFGASNGTAGEGDGGRAALRRLAELDWPAAASIVEPHLRSRDFATRFEAARFLLPKAKNEVRARLLGIFREIVEEVDAGGGARAYAFRALLSETWEGRDRWILRCFEDDSLHEMQEGSTLYRPLLFAVALEPDKWIPHMVRRLGGTSKTAHNFAVSALAQFHQKEDARADALRPLIPWIADRHWSDARDRLGLLQGLAHVDLPEAMPALMKALSFESDYGLTAVAAEFERRPDPAAAAPLRAAMERRGKYGSHLTLRVLLRAWEACGGYDDAERLDAYEAYARFLLDHPKVADRPHALTLAKAAVRLGWLASQASGGPERLRQPLIERARALAAEEPQLAQLIQTQVSRWKERLPPMQWVQRLKTGRVTAAQFVEHLLGQRGKHAPEVREALGELAKAQGGVGGCALAALGDVSAMAVDLSKSGHDRVRALLACARLARDELPIKVVAELMKSQNADVSDAAEAYLRGWDTPAARVAVWARHPNRALVLGALGRENAAWAKHLAAEARGESGPEEIIALLSHSNWGRLGQVVIRVRPEMTTLSYHHADRKQTAEVPLTTDELTEVREFLTAEQVDQLPAFTRMAFDGVQHLFLRVSRAGGYGVFMNNPEIEAVLDENDLSESAYARLTRYFRTLASRKLRLSVLRGD